METVNLFNESEQYLSEAREQILAEQDTYKQLQLRNAALEAGDALQYDPEIFTLFSSMSEEGGDSSYGYRPLEAKRNIGHSLLETLAKNDRYDEAYQLYESLCNLTIDGLDIHAASSLLKNGYAGPENELLDLYKSNKYPLFKWDSLHNEIYMSAITNYGIDVSKEESPYIGLYQDVLDDRSNLGDHIFKRLVSDIANGGQSEIEVAVRFANKIDEPTLHSEALTTIAENTNDTELLQVFIEDVTQQLSKQPSFKNEERSRSNGYSSDEQKLGLDLGYLYALNGNISKARILFEEFKSDFSRESNMRGNLIVYGQSGELYDRAKALNLLNNLGNCNDNYVRDIIRNVAQSDLDNNNVTESLTSEYEVVPLLARELQEYLAQLDKQEDGTESETITYPDYLPRNNRSAVCGALATILAENGAPRTARQIADYIYDPVENVRTKTAIAFIYEN